MVLSRIKISIIYALLLAPFLLDAQSVKIVTNHVGYEDSRAKHAMIVADSKLSINAFNLVDAVTGVSVFTGKPVFSGPVNKWKNFQFWTIDFSAVTTPGTYKLQIQSAKGPISSYPFIIGKNVLEKATVSDV